MYNFWQGFHKKANPVATSLRNAFGGGGATPTPKPPPPPPPPPTSVSGASSTSGFFSNALSKLQGSRFR